MKFRTISNWQVHQMAVLEGIVAPKASLKPTEARVVEP